jgi:hypothetical protein
MSPMAEMSRAVRGVLERYGDHLSQISTETLTELHTILAAFTADLAAELKRRKR